MNLSTEQDSVQIASRLQHDMMREFDGAPKTRETLWRFRRFLEEWSKEYLVFADPAERQRWIDDAFEALRCTFQPHAQA